MKLLHAFAILEFVLTGKYLLVCKTSALNRQKCAVYMRIQLVEMYNKSRNVLLTIFATYECIYILGPLFYFRFSFDMGIVGIVFKIHGLTAKGKL